MEFIVNTEQINSIIESNKEAAIADAERIYLKTVNKFKSASLIIKIVIALETLFGVVTVGCIGYTILTNGTMKVYIVTFCIIGVMLALMVFVVAVLVLPILRKADSEGSLLYGILGSDVSVEMKLLSISDIHSIKVTPLITTVSNMIKLRNVVGDDDLVMDYISKERKAVIKNKRLCSAADITVNIVDISDNLAERMVVSKSGNVLIQLKSPDDFRDKELIIKDFKEEKDGSKTK